MLSTTAVALKRTILKLQNERTTHVAAIDELDKVFSQFGIKLDGAPKRGRRAKKRGRKPGRPKKAKRGRKPGKRKAAPSTGKPTGTEFIMGVIKATGKAGANSSEISTAWKKARRTGSPTPYLFKMAKAGKVQKRNIRGKKGSVYREV